MSNTLRVVVNRAGGTDMTWVACQVAAGTGDPTHLFDNLILIGLSKALLQLVRISSLAFGDIDENAIDLEDLVQVGLDACPPFLDLVFVAGNL